MKKILLIAAFLVGCANISIKEIIETPQIPKEDDVYDTLNLYVDSFLFENTILKDAYANHPIEWKIISGHGEIVDNTVKKTEGAQEYEPIQLQANYQNESYIFDNIILLDASVGYLMTYFKGDSKAEEQVFYAWTFDGLLWYPINHQKSVLKATTGTRRLRDPSIVRGKNGHFYLIATQGFDNASIYVFDTEDLVHFQNERLLQVNISDNELPLLEKQAWAPEAFYDRRVDKYVIYWSSPSDKGMFYNYTTDFYQVSLPQKLVDVGFEVIDGTLLKEDFGYSIVLKDERQPMEKYSQLFVGYGKDYNQITNFDFNYFSNHQSEGPFIIKRGYDYLLYYDDYTRHKFNVMQFYELKSNLFEKIPDTEIISSLESLKHASVIPLTWKEFERIKNVYETTID